MLPLGRRLGSIIVSAAPGTAQAEAELKGGILAAFEVARIAWKEPPPTAVPAFPAGKTSAPPLQRRDYDALEVRARDASSAPLWRD